MGQCDATPCGSADRLPAATIVSNDIPSAPAQRAAYSISAATAVSLTPLRMACNAGSRSEDPSATAFLMIAISSASFTIRRRSISCAILDVRIGGANSFGLADELMQVETAEVMEIVEASG